MGIKQKMNENKYKYFFYSKTFMLLVIYKTDLRNYVQHEQCAQVKFHRY